MKKDRRFIIYDVKKKLATADTYEEACDYVMRLPVERIGECWVKDTEFKKDK
jgi:hypothetical protein